MIIPYLISTISYGKIAGYTTIAFKSLSLSPSSTVNLNSNAYTLELSPSVDLAVGSQLFLTFSSASMHTFLPS